MLVDLKGQTSSEILEYFEKLDVEDGQRIEIEVLESDIESIGYKAFVDLAQLFFMKMLTPVQKDDNTVILKFQKLRWMT